MNIGLTGGDGLRAKLEEIKQKVGDGELLRLGFLENATYPDGTPVAYIASINEYGATFTHPGGTKYITDAVVKGRFVGSRFVGSDFAGEHQVTGPHEITIPARPFFRHMIAEKSPGWGAKMAKALKAADCNVDVAFARMGEGIKGQLQESIRSFVSPALAKSTIRKKGFDKPLIDSGDMLRAVDYDIKQAGNE